MRDWWNNPADGDFAKAEDFLYGDSKACRYATKRTYRTREAARAGARDIRASIEARGRTYSTLYPHPCPDAEHWHLSSRRQGRADCAWCGERRHAWRDAGQWIIASHGKCPSGPARE